MALPVESSRGCWWGAKHYCVNCGIRDEDLADRSRGPAAVLHSLNELNRRHGVRAFRFSDYILPAAYYDSLLLELERRGAPYMLSGEIKANVNADRFGRLVAASFAEVQPGIESFENEVPLRPTPGRCRPGTGRPTRLP